MTVQRLFRRIAKQADRIAKKVEADAKKLLTKACMNERSRIKKQIAFKSSGKKGTRSKPGERPRTAGGKLNKMMQVHVYPDRRGNASVSIKMRWKAPTRRQWSDAKRAAYMAVLRENKHLSSQELKEKWREIERNRFAGLYRGKSPAIALDEGFGNTRPRPYLKWIKETVKIDLRNALEKAGRQIGHIKKKQGKR